MNRPGLGLISLVIVAIAVVAGCSRAALQERKDEIEFVSALQGAEPRDLNVTYRYRFVSQEGVVACATPRAARGLEPCDLPRPLRKNEVVDTIGSPRDGVFRILCGTAQLGEDEGYVRIDQLGPLPDTKAYAAGLKALRGAYPDTLSEEEWSMAAFRERLVAQRAVIKIAEFKKADLLGFQFTSSGLIFAVLVPEHRGSGGNAVVPFSFESQDLLKTLQGQRYVCETEYCDKFAVAAELSTDEGGQPMFRIMRFVDRFGGYQRDPPSVPGPAGTTATSDPSPSQPGG